jgi:hypothetical protein
MNTDESNDIRWIFLRPSNVNLGLTLIAPLCAVALLFIIDLPDWGRAVIATAVFLVTIVDVYFVRHRNARAISALCLERREGGVVAAAPAEAEKADKPQRERVLRLR